MPDQAEVMAWLTEQPSVRFVTRISHGEAVIALTRDTELVKKLEQRDGVSARWYDRTNYSTQAGGEPTWEAEVVFGPRFWEET
jgi:hypothetical protein